MKRRALLRTAAALGSGALAGCSALLGGDSSDGGDSDDDAPPTATDRPTTEPPTRTTTTGDGPSDETPTRPGNEPARGETERFRWDPVGDVVERQRVGDPDSVPFPEHTQPVTVRLWNESLSRHRFRLGTDGDAATLGPGDVLVVELVEPAASDCWVYRDRKAMGRLDVGYEDFDCNHTSVRARVRSGGSFQSYTSSTLMGCPAPEVLGTRLNGGETTCVAEDALASPGSASVEVAGASLNVSGSVEVPTACHEVTDVRTAYTPEEGRLDVEVTATATDTGCRECAAGARYAAVVDLAKAYPGTVVVTHATVDREREVERWELAGPEFSLK